MSHCLEARTHDLGETKHALRVSPSLRAVIEHWNADGAMPGSIDTYCAQVCVCLLYGARY